MKLIVFCVICVVSFLFLCSVMSCVLCLVSCVLCLVSFLILSCVSSCEVCVVCCVLCVVSCVVSCLVCCVTRSYTLISREIPFICSRTRHKHDEFGVNITNASCINARIRSNLAELVSFSTLKAIG